MTTTATDQRQGTAPSASFTPAATGDAPAWTLNCLNCGASLGGDYCAACGQRALPPDPTIRELAGDAFSEFSGWDGKFFATLKLLLLQPGELTRRFLAGQRIQFISPLRIYLACSFVFFGLSALAPVPKISAATGSFSVAPGVSVGVQNAKPAAAPTSGMAALSTAIDRGLNNVDPATRAGAEKQIAKAPGFARPIVRAMVVDQKRLLANISEAMPRALFVLIPGVALTLALFYRGRHYPEHIYFAVHFEAFIFLMLAVDRAAQITGIAGLTKGTQIVVNCIITAYGVIALRRVYGGSFGVTVAKGIGVAALSALIWFATAMTVVYWAAVKGAVGT